MIDVVGTFSQLFISFDRYVPAEVHGQDKPTIGYDSLTDEQLRVLASIKLLAVEL